MSTRPLYKLEGIQFWAKPKQCWKHSDFVYLGHWKILEGQRPA